MRAFIKPHEAIEMIKSLGEDAMLTGFCVTAKKKYSIEQKSFGSKRLPKNGEELTHISNVPATDKGDAIKGKSF